MLKIKEILSRQLLNENFRLRISPCKNGEINKEVNCRKWIKLLLSALIPLMIGVFTVFTTLQQNKISTLQRDQDIEEARLSRKHSEHQADNLHKENVFATYLEEVSQLLMSDKEKSSLIQIRTKTLSSLRQLDSERKKHLLLYLYDSNLICQQQEKGIAALLDVNDADFTGVYFQGTTETSCSFIQLDLHHVYLSNASFIDCYFHRSHFSYSIMYKANFFKSRLFRISFKFARLDKSSFNQATIFDINFLGASLIECDFTDTIWKYDQIDFTNANLTRAVLSDEQLSLSIINNSVLPNGTWGPILSTNLIVNGDAEINVSINFFILFLRSSEISEKQLISACRITEDDYVNR